MKRPTRNLLPIGIVALVSLGIIGAQAPIGGAGGKKTDARMKTKQAWVRPASDAKWRDVPNIEGLKRDVIWGNPEKTAYGALEKLPAGASLPLHWHTYEVNVVVLSGTPVVGLEGKPAQELGPDSYYSLPGGVKYTRACKSEENCVVFVMQSGLDDTKWGEGK